MADTTQNILDLRPPKDSMKAELYRLGLRYTYSTDNGEIWQNDTRGIRATLTNTNQDKPQRSPTCGTSPASTR